MQYVKGPLLVSAGAGSGKTSLLVHKITWLIREYGVDPATIVAVTANAQTAMHIRLGVHEVLGRKVPDLVVSSFDAFCLKVVQQCPEALGRRPGFSLYDEPESEAVVSRLLRERRPQALALTREVWRHLAAWKRDLALPAAPATEPTELAPAQLAAWLREDFDRRLRTANAIDLADLAAGASRLLNADAALLAACRERVRFLLVDEYEQSSAAEHAIVCLLAAHGTVITVTGDDRAVAGITHETGERNLARLKDDVPDLRVIALDQNFRSTARLLAAAGVLLAPGRAERGMPAYRAREQGARLRVLQTRSEQHAAEVIVQALIDQKFRHADDYPDYAIVFRRPEQVTAVERALHARGVPYHLRGDASLFSRSEVRDFWAYLRLLCNPADDNAFLRALITPRRDIDHATVERLMRFAADRDRPLLACALQPELANLLAPPQQRALRSIAELLHTMVARAEYVEPVQLAHDLLAELRYEEWLRDTCNDFNIAARRMDNVMQLVEILSRLSRRSPEADLRSLIAELNCNAVLDPLSGEASAEGVALISLPAVRGLEFAHVYLVGFDDALATPLEPERAEERRLAHLGVTRARETVTFTIAEHRCAPGAAGYPRGGLLNELSPQDLEWLDLQSGRALAESALANAAALNWDKGAPTPR